MGGEGRVAEFLAAIAARAGLDVEFRPVLPGRSNILARLEPRNKRRRRILLAPHLDTVPGQPDQFKPRVKAGRLFGRGACDTKGSVAAMFTALCELAKNGARPAETEIIFVGLVDEENGQAGSRSLAAGGFKADLAIVGEATKLQVVTAHKGSMWLRLQTRGKAAHGAQPYLGRNAIYSMARVIHLLENDYARRLSRRRHPLLGSPTVSVGLVSGGTQANIVPDRCNILVDRRTLPGETETSVCRELCALVRRNHLAINLEDGKLEPCRPLETNHKLPLVARFMRCVGQARPAAVHYFCDAAVLAGGGIPSVVFGPGDIAQAHTADEWIALAELEHAKDLLLRYLKTI